MAIGTTLAILAASGLASMLTGMASSAFSGGLNYTYSSLLQNQANEFSAQEAEKNRVWEAEQAEINRQWQTEMSNTQYQRAVADMKAAGLNVGALGGTSSGSNVSSVSTPAGYAAQGNNSTINSQMSNNFGITTSAILNAMAKNPDLFKLAEKEAVEESKNAVQTTATQLQEATVVEGATQLKEAQKLSEYAHSKEQLYAILMKQTGLTKEDLKANKELAKDFYMYLERLWTEIEKLNKNKEEEWDESQFDEEALWRK